MPRGGFPYTQPDPKGRDFPSVPMLEAQAQTVLAYRKGNGLARATYHECIEDVDHFTANRLGNDPRFTVAINVDAPAQIAISETTPGLSPCAGCGAVITA